MTDAPAQVQKLLRQQAAIARFGSFALRERDLSNILNQAVRICAESLDVPFSKVCRYRAEQNDLLIVAGHGWQEGVVGHVVSRADSSSPQGRAFVTGEPQIIDNLQNDPQFDPPPFYAAHGIVSIIDVIIKGSDDQPYGILEIDNDRQHDYDQYDINFLTGFANVLAEAVSTAARGASLQTTVDRMKALVEEKDRLLNDKNTADLQLRQAQKMEAVGQLTGGIAHDFNNLLGVIIGNLDLLERLVADNEAAIKRVQTAQKAATRGADITRRLLVFSSSEQLKPSVVLLGDSIQNMIELAGHALGAEIKITNHIDASMPPLFVDPAGLESALLNLAMNARDAMPKGGSIIIESKVKNLGSSHLAVHTGDLKAGSYVCVSISDTGAGMSRETLERAFEPFFTTKPRNKGTGLGLAMVYGFVKQSGGAVRAYSELGQGTTISLYLPLTADSSQPVPAGAPKPLSAKPSGSVLVVDDEVELIEIAQAYLAEMGFTGYEAIDGASALEMIAQHSEIDLMVTDIVMPGGMNGVELAQRARTLRPGLKIVYSSGFPAEALAEKSLPLIDGPLLHKPYQRAEFATMVRQVMEGNNAAPAK